MNTHQYLLITEINTDRCLSMRKIINFCIFMNDCHTVLNIDNLQVDNLNRQNYEISRNNNKMQTMQIYIFFVFTHTIVMFAPALLSA